MSKKIVLVEDDALLGKLITKKLISAGYEISIAVDGESGLSSIREKSPDLVLLDLVLPNMDGFEILKRLKSNPATNKIPVIIISNLNQKEDMNRCFQLGASEYIVKAFFTSGEILEMIEKFINKEKE